MKKQLLTAALAFVSVGSFAQTFHEMPDLPADNSYLIPAVYAKDGKTSLLFADNLYNINSEKNNIFVYDDNLSLQRVFSVKGSLRYMYFTNADDGVSEWEGFFTQTLFNDDESYEYFEAEQIEENNTYYVAALKLMSDNGKELARFSFPKPIRFPNINVLRFGGKDYLILSGSIESDSTYFRKIYAIDKSSNAENAIHEVTSQFALSAFPSLAQRNQNVSIQLGDHASGRLQVVSSNGSVVRQIPIQEGQTSVQLNTRGLPSGMYVVSVVGANGTQENCKIVIR